MAVEEVAEGSRNGSLFARRALSGSQLATLTRQLSTLIGADLPIDEALAALSEQDDNERQRALTVSLRSRVMEGASLAHAKISGVYFPVELSADEILMSFNFGTRLRYHTHP